MRHISVRVDDKLYTDIKEKAEETSTPLAEYVRARLRQMCGNGAAEKSESTDSMNVLAAQLQAKDAQISQLTQELRQTRQSADDASKRSDSIVMQLSKTLETQQSQLKDQTLLIEDLRQPRRSFWGRLLKRNTARLEASVS